MLFKFYEIAYTTRRGPKQRDLVIKKWKTFLKISDTLSLCLTFVFEENVSDYTQM